MRNKTKAEHEADRTQILRLLIEIGFHPATPVYVQAILDDTYHTMSDEGLDFQLRYMADKGWIEVGEERIPGNQPRLLYLKITAEGVEEYDRRRRQIVKIARGAQRPENA